MDELTFWAVYLVIVIGLTGLLFFLFSRKLDRKTYLTPVVIGFLFVVITSLFVGGGFLSFLFGGILTGYLINKTPQWLSLFRAGWVNGILVLIALFVPLHVSLFKTSLSDILAIISATGEALNAEGLLYALFFNFLYYLFIIIVMTGLGAVLGGYLRKVLKPAAPKT